ncbi:hypothetical protein [Endothiovibrio diazotrophicus]
MKIEQAQVQLSSSHRKTENSETSEHLRAWQDGVGSLEYQSDTGSSSLRAEAERLRDAPADGANPGPPSLDDVHKRIDDLRKRLGDDDQVSLSPEALAVHAGEVAKAKQASGELDVENLGDLKLSITKLMVEAYTGRKIEFYHPNQDGASGGSGGTSPVGGSQGRDATQGTDEREGWGMVYEYRESHSESEQTSFAAHGVVRTEDGREINFTAAVEMAREFTSNESLSIRAGDALKDPLVINYNGTAAQLSEEQMAFDIDSDGKKDQIAVLSPNSAFLALDRNGDGTINNGNELFGAQTGDGFKELAALDEDGNRWIDENDSGYSKLLLWSPSAEGNGSLSTLAERNIGAIYLGNVSTQFDLKDSSNDLQGQVRSSSVYLNEDGTPGTIQQIDLVA